MADDLTDALRAIIEPMKDELITAAQAHKLAAIRGELGDIVRHAERAMELITDLVPLDHETDWKVATERKPQGPPPDEPPGGSRRGTPQPGQVWEFSGGRHWPGQKVLAQIEPAGSDGVVDMAIVVAGCNSGTVFKFNQPGDPYPVRLRGFGGPSAAPSAGPRWDPMADETDASGNWKS